MRWSAHIVRKVKDQEWRFRGFKPEESVAKVQQVGVLIGQGMPEINAIRQINMTEQTCYRWEEKYGGMDTDLRNELKWL